MMLYIVGAGGGLGSGLIEHLNQNKNAAAQFGGYKGLLRKDLDLTDQAASERYWQEADKHLKPGAPIFVINAAGRSINGYAHKLSLEEWERMLKDNLTSNFLLLRGLVPILKSRPGSSILIFSSVVAEIGVPGTIAYASSKSAIRGFVRTAARELARSNATINCLELGYFDRGMIDQVPKEHVNKLVTEVPVGRLGNVEDLFQGCQFALTCGYVTGTAIKLNGGLT
jgi:NAD(P)-dependent dehydrogenase (short-subunit alcohol dehydrogenase family)